VSNDEIPAAEPVEPDDALEPDDRDGTDGFGRTATGWQPPEPTGVQAVDEALAPLARLDELPTVEHVGVYESVHRHLQDALADLDSA
jgi:hypothetical protein